MIKVTEKYGIDVETSADGVVNYAICRLDRGKMNSIKGKTFMSYPKLFFFSSFEKAVGKIAVLEQAALLEKGDHSLADAVETIREVNLRLARLIEEKLTVI